MRRALVAVLVLALPACTVGVRRSHGHPSARPVSHAPVVVPACRTTYVPPDPKRPKIRLELYDEDLLEGEEHVTFTPDRPITEVMFRLWLNGPLPASKGGRIDVVSASLPMRYEAAGAPKSRPGTLLVLTLPKQVPAGRAVTVDLAFRIDLPKSGVDRWGRNASTDWWASAHPMLAYVRGTGWVTDPAVGLLGESATSDAADYDVHVTAGKAFTVLGNGVVGEREAEGLRYYRWHFHNDRARDIAVVVGKLQVRQTTIDGVPVVVGVDDKLVSDDGAEAVFGPVLANATTALRALVQRFGPYPFASLTIAAMKPIKSAGVEYPGLVMVGSTRYEVVVPHELAHQWFYGLVGDNQARDPWLDEAFATYGESLVNDDADRFLDTLDTPGDVGRPMTYWDKHRGDYSRVVYGKGAAALLTARDATGAAAFDKLLRCYVNTHAYRVATPAALAAALAPAAAATTVLREAGALP